MILFAHLARADVSCPFASVVATVPFPDATDVPIDVRPAVVLLNAYGSCSATRWEVALLRADDGSSVTSASFTDEDARDGLLELEPVMEADTAYLLQVTPIDGLGQVTEVAFTTGSGTVAGLEGAPSVAVDSALIGRGGFLGVAWSARAVEDPDHLSLLRLRDPDLGMSTVIWAADATRDQFTWWSSPVPPDRFCGEISQVDGAGVATEPVQADCVAVRACDSAASSPSAGWLLACVFLARRSSRAARRA